MTRYADPERCPDCLEAMPFGTTRCPSCGLSLEGPTAARLFAALSTADALLAELRATPAPLPVGAPTGATSGATSGATAGVPAGVTGGDETQPRSGSAASTVRHGLSAASVPKILLGLGALCLLVAALVFLAVTWSRMGIGGRTAILVGFTCVAAGLTAWSARGGLRAASESLGVVSLGLLTFDLFGARDAGWMGPVSTPGFLVVLGAVLVVAGAGTALLARRTPARLATGTEVVAALGLATACAGAAGGDWLSRSAGLTVAVVAALAVTYAVHALRLTVLTVGAGLVSGAFWLGLTVLGVTRALAHPSLAELWGRLEVWPLLASASLVAGVSAVTALPHVARLAATALGSLVLATVALAPFVDEQVTTAVLAAAAVLGVAAVAAWFTPQRWRPGLGPLLALGALVMLGAASSVVSRAMERLVVDPTLWWDGAPGTVLPPAPGGPDVLAAWTLPGLLLVLLAALVALARSFDEVDRLLSPVVDLDIAAAVAATALALTLAAYPVPLWLVLALLVVTACGLTWRALAGGSPYLLAGSGGLFLAGLVVALHDEWLTLAALLPILLAALLTHLRWRGVEVAVLAGAVGATSLGGSVWTVGAVWGTEPTWVAVAAVVALAVVALGLPYVDTTVRRNAPAGVARLGWEGAALGTAAVITVVALAEAPRADVATWAAVYLTLVGAAVAATALLRPDRRAAGWLGGLLLAAATWVRLADLGVDTPEAYTLPSALALLAVGLVHLRRDPGAGTLAALTPGLLLALTPSLLWVLADPIALRSVLLGVACLALVVGGVRLHWNAPVVHAAVVGALLVLRHTTPLAEAVPRWALIGAAGSLLVALGVTWEQRLREARTVAGFVRTLR